MPTVPKHNAFQRVSRRPRLPWTIVRRVVIDEVYETGRAAGMAVAEQLVGALDSAVARRDMHAVALIYPVLVVTLTAERARWQNGGAR